jgi:PIN domain nuclease of toxin-antitoxin system
VSQRPGIVLDSSAFLAYLFLEPGAELVEQSLAGSAAMSAVNFAETLSRISDLGQDVDETVRRLAQRGLTGAALLVFPLDERQAREIARLRRQTRALGLSLGDRACLALGRVLELPVETADCLWQSLDLGIEVQAIR